VVVVGNTTHAHGRGPRHKEIIVEKTAEGKGKTTTATTTTANEENA
jgi:hypothetical protein